MSNPSSNRSTPIPRGRPAPRAGYTRKSKAERERYAAEQADREKQRNPTPSDPLSSARGRAGARGAGQAGRGGTNREQGHQRGDGTGFSVFGGNIGAAKTRNKDAAQGREEWLAGGARTKEEIEQQAASAAQVQATSSGGKGLVTADVSASGVVTVGKGTSGPGVYEIVVPEDDEGEVERRDIERIWISSDDEAADAEIEDEQEDDIVTSKGKRRADSGTKPRIRKSAGGGGGLRPVRAPRTRVDTDDLQDEDTKGKRAGALRKPKREAAAAQVILDDSDAMEVDPPVISTADNDDGQPLKSPPSSPEVKKKALAATTRRLSGPRTKSAAGHQETQEERAERLRVVDDTNKLLSIFAPNHLTTGTMTAASKNKAKAKATIQALEEGKLFLMQFPPITPLLVNPAAHVETDGDGEGDDVKVKSEHEVGTASTAPQQQKGATTHKSSGQAVPQPSSGLLTADSTAKLPHGRVGKLNVHASGKISLDWGGCSLDVKLGTEVDFLQDAVLLEQRLQPEQGQQDGTAEAAAAARDEDEAMENGEEDTDNEKGKRGKEKDTDEATNAKAYPLGQVHAKLVVTPDFARLFD